MHLNCSEIFWNILVWFLTDSNLYFNQDARGPKWLLLRSPDNPWRIGRACKDSVYMQFKTNRNCDFEAGGKNVYKHGLHTNIHPYVYTQHSSIRSVCFLDFFLKLGLWLSRRSSMVQNPWQMTSGMMGHIWKEYLADLGESCVKVCALCGCIPRTKGVRMIIHLSYASVMRVLTYVCICIFSIHLVFFP
jgi:hypothetical protein